MDGGKWMVFVLVLHGSYAQQASSSLGDFVKQLTTLISQNGGIGSLVNAIPHGEPYPGYQDNPYPPSDGYPSQYPEYAPQYPDGYYEDLRPASRPPQRPSYRPPYRPHYPPGPGYAPEYPQRPGYAPEYPQRPGYALEYPQGPGYAPDNAQPGYYGPHPGYPQQGLMAALGSIARHDDLRCVPRLLCEVTSGGKPGYPSYISTGQQTAKDTIATLLTVLNFMDDNPLFIFGRAALLGAASRGNSAACLDAYPTCPRDADRLVHYLNNHNGGFFRFFGGLPGEQRGVEGNAEETETDSDSGSLDGEARIQYKPTLGLYSRYPTRESHSLKYVSPAEAQDYLPPSAHGAEYSTDRIVFPSEHRTPGRGGKLLHFPEDSDYERRPSYSSGLSYRPDFSPPQNQINFRDQRSVKFPVSMNFPEV